MAKVSYVACPSCHKEYYIDRILSDVLETNPNQPLKCPFCKQEFRLGQPKTDAKPAASTAR
jgi:hypothetical protein